MVHEVRRIASMRDNGDNVFMSYGSLTLARMEGEKSRKASLLVNQQRRDEEIKARNKTRASAKPRTRRRKRIKRNRVCGGKKKRRRGEKAKEIGQVGRETN